MTVRLMIAYALIALLVAFAGVVIWNIRQHSPRQTRLRMRERQKEQTRKARERREEKEKDALESGIRKGVRSDLLKQLAQKTRDIAIQSSKKEEELGKNGIKLAKVLASLEKNTGLLEVNLKDEAALENFYLSSLRIWSSR